MKITAAVVPSVGADFDVRTVDIDLPGTGEIAIRTAGVGICHTDIGVRDGHPPFPLPGILGHEGSGIVRALADGVTGIEVGDKVDLHRQVRFPFDTLITAFPFSQINEAVQAQPDGSAITAVLHHDRP